jgi:hypothetical protein
MVLSHQRIDIQDRTVLFGSGFVERRGYWLSPGGLH